MAVNKVMYDNDTLIDTSNDTALEEYVMEGFTFHSYSGEKLTGNLNVYNMVANAYDETATYAVGDYVIHEKYLYQCSTAISTAEAWNPAHWTEVTIGDELEEANAGIANTYTKSEVDTTLGNYYTKTQIDTTIGNYYNKNQIDSKVTQINNNTAAAYSTSSQYNIGDYCLKDGVLYRCTTAIPSGEAWTSGHWTAVDIADDMRRVFDVTNDNVAELYDSTKTYALGAFCIYQDNLYRCTTAITTAEAFNALHWTQTNVGNEIDNINTALETKAEIDGYYEDLTAGSAEQLISSVSISDNAPYLFRTSGGNVDIGNRETDKLVGGTVAWNQLVQYGDFSSSSGWSIGFTISDGIASATYDSTGAYNSTIYRNEGTISGHKYLVFIRYKCTATNKIRIRYPVVSSERITTANTWEDFYWIVSPSSNGAQIGAQTNSITGETSSYKYFMCFDLTQMFGSTIADYIYSLEQANAGDGVAWFRKYFPKDYYAYNAGELMSVKTSAHQMTGFNQWDEVWELGGFNYTTGETASATDRIRSKNYCKCLPSMQYYWRIPSENMRILFYDANKNYITFDGWYDTARIITTPSNAYYFKLAGSAAYGTTYKNDICINLHWDGERDGEYEPYKEHSYALDSDLELRGIPKLDANDDLYYDGDAYESDGTVTRRYGVVDLGTLSYTINNHATLGDYFYANITSLGAKRLGDFGTTVYNAKISKYVCASRSLALFVDKTFCFDGSVLGVTQIQIKDSSYNDATAFKASLSGVYLVYELATPTTESADPYTNPQIVNDWGTEEYVDSRDVQIPVGHETLYQANLKAKLEMAPNSPSDGDGDYIVRQTNGENAYVKLVKELPEQPSDTVDYGLKSNSESLSWQKYDEMIVGNAKQLISSVGIEDQVPYNFRTSGGSNDIGTLEEDTVVGGTVAWNQLAQDYADRTISGVSIHQNADGSYTLNGTATETSYFWITPNIGIPQYIQPNHKYFASSHSQDFTKAKLQFILYGTPVFVWNEDNGKIFSTPNSFADKTGFGFVIQFFNGAVFNNFNLSIQLHDLTQMFGSAIADYLYALETANAGDGVAWFKKLFPKPYYAYNSGELMSVKTSAHQMTGFNQCPFNLTKGTPASAFDATKCVRVIKGQTYELSHGNVTNATTWRNAFSCFDFDGNRIYTGSDITGISGSIGGNLSGLYYVDGQNGTVKSEKFTSNFDGYIQPFILLGDIADDSVAEDTCIHYVWDGERNGEYEPYKLESYPLDSDLELKGIPKLDASNNLYYDGDIYEPDGTVTRRYIDLNLGNQTYNSKNTLLEGVDRFQLPNCGVKTTSNNVLANIICPLFVSDTLTHANANYLTGVVCAFNNDLWFFTTKDKYADSNAFKTAMSGIHIVFEAETLTTESADPYQNPQIVDDWGTEEYVDERTVPIPVGHKTFYQANLKAKLEMAPDSPGDGDGLYAVRQTDGENSYEKIIFPTELPAAPTTDGSYRLKVTVTDGTPVLSWESIS